MGTVDLMSTQVRPDVGSDPGRLISLHAVHNFRDLGGYPTEDGRVTRWRTLYRADSLQRLVGEDLEIVRTLGLRTVVDLRTAGELEERGRFPEADHPVDFHHYSVMDSTWMESEPPSFDTDAEFLHWAYTTMLRTGAESLASAMRVLAAPGALPGVFHCAAGKDRTGILAMLILGSIGVPHEYISADYALTAAGMVRMREWAKVEYVDMVERMKSVPSAFFAAVPEAMDMVIRDICAEHGDIRGFVRHLGVADEVIEALAAAVLTDADLGG